MRTRPSPRPLPHRAAGLAPWILSEPPARLPFREQVPLHTKLSITSRSMPNRWRERVLALRGWGVLVGCKVTADTRGLGCRAVKH